MKAHWWTGGIYIHAFFDIGTRWRWVVSLMFRPLYPQGKSCWYPVDRRLGGPQGRSEGGGEKKNYQPLPGLEPPILLPVAQRRITELCICRTIINYDIYIYIHAHTSGYFLRKRLALRLRAQKNFWRSISLRILELEANISDEHNRPWCNEYSKRWNVLNYIHHAKNSTWMLIL
jgi:hypothetical protein